jgi:two-component system NtrC family sensor kinase
MSSAKPQRPTLIQTLLVGEGPNLAQQLKTLALRRGLLRLEIAGIVDLSSTLETEATELARDLGVPFIIRDIDDVSRMKNVHLVLNNSSHEAVAEELRSRLPSTVPVLGPDFAAIFGGIERLIAENRALAQDSRRLKETRLRLNQFVETAPLAIYIKDMDLRYRRMNSHALHVLGLKEEDVIGKTDHTLYPGRGARWLQNVEQETLRTGKTLHATGVLPVMDQDMHVQVTLFPIIENGETEGLYGLVEDTTELFESEQKLHEVDEQLNETQKYLREVLENSRDIIFLTDPTGVILSFNSGAEKALGWERDEVVGTPAANLAELPGRFDHLFQETLREGHASRYEAVFRGKDGRSIICNTSLTLIDGPDGSPLEVVCLCRDITNRLQLKNDLIRSERLAAVGQMASGVAHEINNPLAVIDTIAGLVEETLVDEGQALLPETREILTRAMTRLHHQVKRCTRITHSLLGFVRKEHAGMAMIQLDKLLDECLDVVGTEIRRSGTQINKLYQPKIPEFKSDPMLLQQVFVNLFKNAIDAIEEMPDRPGTIELITHLDGERIIISIEDNGVGIPEKDQEKIFNLFHTTKPAGKGTGLGLSIVHDILHRLGGHIRVASVPGKWSRFLVELPLKAPDTLLPDPTSMEL